MNTYKPDLDLRRRVAEACGWIELQEFEQDVFGNFNGQWDIVEEYDTSFDAILPMVRELEDIEEDQLWRSLWEPYSIYFDNDHAGTNFAEWLIYEATPTDYCRAYLAAKGRA